MVMELKQNVILTKIEEYLDTRKWSLYRLAKEAEIQYSSLHSMFEKNTQPTIPTLMKICKGLGISMSDFFSDTLITEFSHCTEDEQELLNIYRELDRKDKQLILSVSRRFAEK